MSGAEPASVTPAMRWYVLRVASNKEDQVREALARKVKIEALHDRVGRILVPSVKEKRVKAGVSRVWERKLYPGYVFVEMSCEEDGSIPDKVWFVIKETSGVGDFIGSEGKPTSMSEHDASAMLAVAEKSDEEPSMSGILKLKKGDRVKITNGAFDNFEGEVEAVDDRRGTVQVVLSIFGRSTPVEVEYWQLERAE